MGSQQLWGTSAGVPSVESYTLQAIWGDDTRAKPEHDYQRRALKTYRDRNRWVSLWPRGGIMMGDPSGTECVGGYCDCFEPFSCDGEGTQSSNFIRGRVLDVSSNPVAAIVQGFRTSDDAFVGQVNARADGYYDLPTFNATNVQHYLVAYNAGSPDRAGTTVNTITPTKVDGT
jgi:hypothetical protein